MHKTAQKVRHCAAMFKRCLLTESYVHAPSKHKLLGITLGRQLEVAVNKRPDKTAVVFTNLNKQYTFAQFFAAVDDLAAAFLAQGVRKGDRIGVWGPNTPEWLLAQFATARVGAVMVNVNPHYRPAELQYAMNKVGVSHMLVADRFKNQDYYAMLAQVCPELRTRKPSEWTDEAGFFKAVPSLKRCWMMADSKQHPGTLAYSELLASANNEHRRAVRDLQKKLHFDEPINIQFTSGTTGNPKGATLTHHNVLNNAYFAGLRFGYHAEEAVLCAPVPFYHCLGCVLINLQLVCHNSTVVVPDLAFHAEHTLGAIERTKATSLYGTPTMFIDMMHHPHFSHFDLTSLRTGMCTGAPCPAPVMRQIVQRMHMPDLRIGYGTTENSPLDTLGLATDEPDQRLNTVGVATEHIELKLVDSDDTIVPIGQPGEVQVRGYNVMLGYWNDEKKTKEVITEARWYKTGDIGQLDEHGYLRIIGRMKDLIIRGGENIYPAEVEKLMLSYRDEQGTEQLADVQVVGVPDERLGEEVCAFIKLKPQASEPKAEQLRSFCATKMARYKIPKYFLFLTQFPMTVSGKVQKFELRKMAEEKLNLKTVQAHLKY